MFGTVYKEKIRGALSKKRQKQAATRVFSNAAGSYSANVGIAVENGASVDEEQLQAGLLGACRAFSTRVGSQSRV